MPDPNETGTSADTQAAKTPPEEKLSLMDTLKILFGASRGFWLVNQVNFFDGIAYFGILNLLTLYIGREVGFSDEMKTVAVSAFTGMVTLFMFGGGFITDKLGVRKALTICLAMVLAGRLLLVGSVGMGSFAGGTLWISLIVMGIAEGILQPTLYAGVKEYTDPRTVTISYSILYAIMNLGIVGGDLASPLIREAAVGTSEAGHGGGAGTVFWVMVGVTVLMLAIQLLFFKKKVEDTQRVVVAEEKTEADLAKTTWEKIRELPFLDSRFLFFIFILLPVRTLFAHQWLTLPDYVVRCFPSGVGARYEWFQALNPIIIVIFVPTIAAMTRNTNIIKMMIIGTTVSALTTFILVPGPHLATLIIYVIVFSFGEAIWSSRFLEYVANLAPAGKVGAYMGLAGIPWFLAKATTGLYAGSMIAHFIPVNGPQDSGTMWLFYAFIAMITPIGLILGRKWVQKGVPQKAAA
ncbi:MAG: MFS transporter [bacterium]